MSQLQWAAADAVENASYSSYRPQADVKRALLVISSLYKESCTITRYSDFRIGNQCGRLFQNRLSTCPSGVPYTAFRFLALCAFVNRLGLEASSGCSVVYKVVNCNAHSSALVSQ